MNFIMLRNKTVASTKGHTIEFKKGVPTYVPPELYDEVQAAGAVPEDELPEEVIHDTKEPLDQAARRAAIFAAFDALIAGQKRESFTGTGVPATKPLTAQLGFMLDSKERDVLWQEYNIAKAEADKAREEAEGA